MSFDPAAALAEVKAAHFAELATRPVESGADLLPGARTLLECIQLQEDLSEGTPADDEAVLCVVARVKKVLLTQAQSAALEKRPAVFSQLKTVLEFERDHRAMHAPVTP